MGNPVQLPAYWNKNTDRVMKTELKPVIIPRLHKSVNLKTVSTTKTFNELQPICFCCFIDISYSSYFYSCMKRYGESHQLRVEYSQRINFNSTAQHKSADATARVTSFVTVWRSSTHPRSKFRSVNIQGTNYVFMFLHPYF